MNLKRLVTTRRARAGRQARLARLACQIVTPLRWLPLLALAGCVVPSLAPTYVASEVRFDPQFIGIWSQRDSSAQWEVTRASGHGYTLALKDSAAAGEVHRMTVRLVPAGDAWLADFCPAPAESPTNQHADGRESTAGSRWAPYYQRHLVPGHSVGIIRRSAATLRVSLLNPHWLKAYLASHPDTLAHTFRADGSIILTASSMELARFMRRHVDSPGAFSLRDAQGRGEDYLVLWPVEYARENAP